MVKSNIFIISGPSGAGEDSIIEGLQKYLPIERVITTTTRAMRPGESQGNPYHFISQEEFLKGVESCEFAEHAQQYNGNYYGVTTAELERVRSAGRRTGKIGLWKMEYKGVTAIKKKYPEIVAIFLNAANLDVLEDRIRHRDNVSEEYIKERMKYTAEWIQHLDMYDYTVINEQGQLDAAIQQVADIIKKHS